MREKQKKNIYAFSMCYLEAEEYVGIVLVMKINAHVRGFNAFFMHWRLETIRATQKNTYIYR